MKRQIRNLILSAATATALLGPQAAFAQRKPPAPPPPAPATAEVVSGIEARTQRLEQAIEQLTGQVEELRYQNQQLITQVQRLQDDLSLRVARLEQGTSGAPPASDAAGAIAPPSPPAPAARPPRGAQNNTFTPSDKFDPNAPMSSPVSRQPTTEPPVPAQAQAAAASAAARGADAAPADNGGFNIRTDAFGKALPPDPNAPKAPPPQAPVGPAPAPRAAPSPGPVASAGLNTAPANVTLPSGTPKEQYDFAFEILRRQDYARAEAALRAFVKANPKDPLAGNAQYWVGETLYVRGDYQSAAVEFMNGYQQYPKSPKGPDNLLKLGMAMSKLNQAQGACTALGRIAKEYPSAPDTVRKTAQTERTKLKCT